jgi:hypothetical protein
MVARSFCYECDYDFFQEKMNLPHFGVYINRRLKNSSC